MASPMEGIEVLPHTAVQHTSYTYAAPSRYAQYCWWWGSSSRHCRISLRQLGRSLGQQGSIWIVCAWSLQVNQNTSPPTGIHPISTHP